MIQRKRAWLAALRSGDYAQTTGVLENHDGQFCCLGVYCRVLGVERTQDEDRYYYPVPEYDVQPYQGDYDMPVNLGGLSQNETQILAAMNDGGRTFLEIADYIEANVPGDDEQ